MTYAIELEMRRGDGAMHGEGQKEEMRWVRGVISGGEGNRALAS